MNDVDARFGDRVRRVRKFRRLSLEDVAPRVGMAISVLSKLETGQRRCTVGEAVVLAEVLDVPLDLLVGDGPMRMSVDL